MNRNCAILNVIVLFLIITQLEKEVISKIVAIMHDCATKEENCVHVVTFTQFHFLLINMGSVSACGRRRICWPHEVIKALNTRTLAVSVQSVATYLLSRKEYTECSSVYFQCSRYQARHNKARSRSWALHMYETTRIMTGSPELARLGSIPGLP
jgi:hypothetical protein